MRREIKSSNNIIVIGNESLYLKDGEGNSAVCYELNLILSQKKGNPNLKLFPILLGDSIEKENSFPPNFRGYTQILDWIKYSYIDNLKELIRALYGVSSNAEVYNEVWSDFYKNNPDCVPTLSRQEVEGNAKKFATGIQQAAAAVMVGDEGKEAAEVATSSAALSSSFSASAWSSAMHPAATFASCSSSLAQQAQGLSNELNGSNLPKTTQAGAYASAAAPQLSSPVLQFSAPPGLDSRIAGNLLSQPERAQGIAHNVNSREEVIVNVVGRDPQAIGVDIVAEGPVVISSVDGNARPEALQSVSNILSMLGKKR